jgi:iron complex outermembrane receptor protein
MSTNISIRRAVRYALLTSVAAASTHALPVIAAEGDDVVAEVVVTGSRIQRQDYVANSPVMTANAEQITANADITLDTYLNTLPQVNPAGGTTSNNPGNGGQSNIDLRGLGANRNLVLIDGRRAMPSDSDMTVDLNTIPQALIESVEIVTGGAGAVYGADAIAGAVNIKLKSNFEGADFRYTFSNSTEYWDAEDYQVSGLLGGNFAEDKGNAVFAFDYSNREGQIKSQRPFSSQATSTTSYLPEGFFIANSGNAIPQTAINTLFNSYGIPGTGAADDQVPTQGILGFNADGSLFSRGIFNNPKDVANWRYANDLNINANLFPDLYSYNFDAVNILTLPLERRSFMGKTNYEFDTGTEVFASFGWTEYESLTALAPTPFPTVGTRAPGAASAIQATSPYVSTGINPATGAPWTVANNLVVRADNPLIPADLATLLAARTGDSPLFNGAGATEPFQMRTRTLGAGLRTSDYENTVTQYMLGSRGRLFSDNWRWEIYASEGRTRIVQTQNGNIDTQKVINAVNNEVPDPNNPGVMIADGGQSLCEGGLDFWGRSQLSQSCIDYIQVPATAVTTRFQQQILQGFISGDVFQMPAGPFSVVVGAEGRWFEYDLDPGASSGPISGLNAQNPAGGENNFKDLFTEALIPLLRDAPLAKALEVSVGYRYSESDFKDTINGLSSDTQDSDAYKFEVSWLPIDSLRARASYQRAVRAPNFEELFDGGGSAPQYFDPCSVTTAYRGQGAAARQLCIDTGLAAGSADLYVQTPGNQISITTKGNTALQPETADTITLGLVFSSPWDGVLSGLQGSLDYYNIDISDPIISPSANMYVAACYNYFGTNPGLSADDEFCQGVVRQGGDVLGVSSPDDPEGLYPGINGGSIKTDGIDLQVNWDMGLPVGELSMNFWVNYLLNFKQQDRPELPEIDYTGTISYFGAGLGTSFPEMRANLGGTYSVGPFAFTARLRWIDSMENRASVQFPGETFKGVPSVTYVDTAVSWQFMEKSVLRIGVNNVTDKQPPSYAPNVQSGTDPSTYDVIGRRIFGQIVVGF